MQCDQASVAAKVSGGSVASGVGNKNQHLSLCSAGLLLYEYDVLLGGEISSRINSNGPPVMIETISR